MTEFNSLTRAVEIAGGQSALARKASKFSAREITQQDVWSWLNRSKRVASDCAIPVEKAVDGKVSRHNLRPDIYPQELETQRKTAAA